MNSQPTKDQRLQNFMKNLRYCSGMLSKQCILTLRGQALSGDIKGAERGLARMCHCADQH